MDHLKLRDWWNYDDRIAYGYELGLVPQNTCQFVKSLASTCSVGELNRARACRCQFSDTSNLHRYRFSFFFSKFFPSGVWQVSASRDEVIRFIPANIFSTLNRNFDNKYELINDAACFSEQDGTSKWNHVFWSSHRSTTLETLISFLLRQELFLFFFLL